MRLLVTLLAALAGLQGLVMGVLVIVATLDWGVPKELYGLFLAAGAVGNVPGALLADSFASRLGNIPMLIGAAIVSGLADPVMASAKGWLLAGVAFAVVSFAVYAGSVVANSLRQRLSPRDLMGGSAPRGAGSCGARSRSARSSEVVSRCSAACAFRFTSQGRLSASSRSSSHAR